jgi:hypothetical protein
MPSPRAASAPPRRATRPSRRPEPRGAALGALIAALALPATPARADEPPRDSTKDRETEAAPPIEAAPTAPPARAAPIVVTVEGERAPPGSIALRAAEVRELPGVLGDPYRAVELQPGVTPIATGIPYFFVRGAPPGNLGFFLDDVRVPLLFHVGGGPSVVPPYVVRGVAVHLGPVPASIGQLAGAAVVAETAAPRASLRAEAIVRGPDLGGFVEAPVTRDLTVLAGGHYAAGAALVSELVPSVDLGYADYQARASLRLGEGERLTVFAFGSRDYLAAVTDDDGERDVDVLLDSDFHRLDARYERAYASGAALRTSVTLGLDRLRDVGVEDARDLRVVARASLSRPLRGGAVVLRGGLDAQVDDYAIVPCPPAETQCRPGDGLATEQLEEAFRTLFPSRTDLAFGAWSEARLALGDDATLTPGARVDVYASLGEAAIAIDPKVVGRFGVGERWHLVPAAGLASQLPGFAPLPALQIGGIPGGLQRSAQASFGVERDLGPVQASATLFRQVTVNLTDPIGTGRGATLGSQRFLSRSLGDGYGLEASAHGAMRRDLLFFASYTLSRTTRRALGRVLPSAYDRTHVANLALLYDLGGGWKAGVRHVFYSGFPADEAAEGRVPSEHPDRVRPFYRLDLRVAKRWKLGERGYYGVILDLQNALLAKEVFDVQCDVGSCTPRTLGPITIPGLAFEVGY